MIIHSASQVLTMKGGPQRGDKLGTLGIVSDGAVRVEGDRISAVGKSSEIVKRYPQDQQINAQGQVVFPGFVDPHTHIVWAGDRADEFEMRVAGNTYQEIMNAGGGIVSTVRETRAASLSSLKEQTLKRMQTALMHGTTTMEAKTGYGLDTETELKLLQALLELDQEHPLGLVFTFLGAHAIPPEYTGRSDQFTDLVCQEMIPALAAWWPEQTDRESPFVDVFCETGAFSLQQSRKILETALRFDFPIKIHADEFDNLGGTSLAAELGAASADHLVVSSAKDLHTLGASNTVAVALPCTPFGLGKSDYTPVEKVLAAGGLLAIATDMNPGTAWVESMQFVIALACRYLKLTPAQAIAAATINAAAAINRSDQIGSLEEGKQADLILLNVPDYRHVGYRFGTNLVHTVIKQGQVVWTKEEV